MKKHILLAFAFVLAASTGLFAQKVWTEPETDIDPNDTLKIYINLAEMDCDKLVGTTDPLYIWTWMPAKPANGGNGDWSNSNPANEWESLGQDIYRFTMIPTEFYGVDAATVFDNDIFFLAKSLDGGSGGDCSAAGDENKTENLEIAVDPPTGGLSKVFSFPSTTDGTLGLTQDDIFTFFYDNALEDKASMQNADDLYVYATAVYTDGSTDRPGTLPNVGDTPSLQMSKDGTIYSWTIQPSRLFSIPDGKTLDRLELQITKALVTTTDETVDGVFTYTFECN